MGKKIKVRLVLENGRGVGIPIKTPQPLDKLIKKLKRIAHHYGGNDFAVVDIRDLKTAQKVWLQTLKFISKLLKEEREKIIMEKSEKNRGETGSGATNYKFNSTNMLRKNVWKDIWNWVFVLLFIFIILWRGINITFSCKGNSFSQSCKFDFQYGK